MMEEEGCQGIPHQAVEVRTCATKQAQVGVRVMTYIDNSPIKNISTTDEKKITEKVVWQTLAQSNRIARSDGFALCLAEQSSLDFCWLRTLSCPTTLMRIPPSNMGWQSTVVTMCWILVNVSA